MKAMLSLQEGLVVKTRNIQNHRQAAAMLEPIRYSIDFVTAILLLMGQITTSGLFVVPDGFYLAATGEILGGVRLTGQTPGTAETLRLVDIISALLLIVNAVRVTGPYITSERMFIVFGGEIFGVDDVVGVAPMGVMNAEAAMELRDFFRKKTLEFDN